MIVSLGILSLLQLTFVPGLILTKIIKIRGFWDNFLVALGLSQLFNYLFVVIATLCHIYTQKTTLILFGIEIILLWVIYFPNLKTSFGKIINLGKINLFFKEYTNLIDSQVEWKNKVYTFVYYFIFIFSVLIIIKNIFLYVMHPTQIFSAWDAVVSWNKWATQWYQGIFPTQTWHYPQLWAANLSIPYQFIGTTQIPYFSKYFSNLIDFLIIAIIFILGIKKKDISYFLGVIFVSWLMGAFGSHGSGYADSPVAFWGLLTVVCLIFAEEYGDERKFILLGALFASAAALTKQAGLWLVLVYPILIATRKIIVSTKSKIIIQSIVIMVLLILPWYLYKEIQIRMGLDYSEISVVTGIVIKNHNIFQLMSSGFDLFLDGIKNPFFSRTLTFFLILILIGFSSKDGFWKKINLFVIIPFWIGWMFFFSYENRNLSLIIPLIAISSGIGLKNILYLDLEKIKNFFQLNNVHSVTEYLFNFVKSIIKFLSAWRVWYLLFLIPVIFILPHWVSDSKLIRNATLKQREIGDTYVNQQIYYFKDHYGLDGKIITSYSFLAFLPELSNYTVLSDTNTPEFINRFKNPEVGYALLNKNWCSDEVISYIYKLIDEKKIKVLMEFEPPSHNGYYYFVTSCHGECK